MHTDFERRLKEAFELFARSPGFPREHCEDVCRFLEREMGLTFVRGFFVLDMPIGEEPYIIEPHKWCEDALTRIIDLTAHQFNLGLNEPLPEGVLIVEPNSPLCKRYLRPGTFNLNHYLDPRYYRNGILIKPQQ